MCISGYKKRPVKINYFRNEKTNLNLNVLKLKGEVIEIGYFWSQFATIPSVIKKIISVLVAKTIIRNEQK